MYRDNRDKCVTQLLETRIADTGPNVHFDADPDPTFDLNADLDTYSAPHESVANPRPLVYKPSTVHFRPPRLHFERPRPSMAPF
jgi:hypothetical protein